MGALDRRAACQFKPALLQATGDAGRDAFVPDLIDAPQALCESWHPHGFDPCMLGAPGSGVELPAANSPYTYDTTNAGGVLYDSGSNVLLTSSR